MRLSLDLFVCVQVHRLWQLRTAIELLPQKNIRRSRINTFTELHIWVPTCILIQLIIFILLIIFPLTLRSNILQTRKNKVSREQRALQILEKHVYFSAKGKKSDNKDCKWGGFDFKDPW